MTDSAVDRPYYDALPVWPEFALPNNTIDGLLPACRVESWERFVEIMRDPDHNKANREMIYRGQRGYAWQLSSTLSRQFDGGAIPDDIRAKLLLEFRLAMRGRGPELKQMEEEEIWAYGQHHGLHTPLLDWTKSPFVALYFAFVESDPDSKDNPSRAIFCLNMSAIKELSEELFVEPKYNDNSRLVNQAGLFTLTPSGSDNFASAIINLLRDNGAIEEGVVSSAGDSSVDDSILAKDIAKYICKFHVPNESRELCLAMLRKMNMHHGSLFPDPSGASRYCNDWLGRYIVDSHSDSTQLTEPHEKAESSIPPDSGRTPPTTAGADADIGQILRSVLGAESPDDRTIKDWAEKIDRLYHEIAPLDWPNRPSGVAKVRTSLNRQLSILEVRSEYREEAVNRIVDFLRRAYLGPELNEKRPAFNFFARASDK